MPSGAKRGKAAEVLDGGFGTIGALYPGGMMEGAAGRSISNRRRGKSPAGSPGPAPAEAGRVRRNSKKRRY